MNSSTSNDLYAAWGSSASDVWAVGADGVAVHYDGESWTVESPPATVLYTLTSVSGSGPNDVYTSDGNLNVYHFDGGGWTKVNSLVPAGVIDFSVYDGAPGSLWIGGFVVGAYYSTSYILYPATATTLGTAQTDSATELFDTPSGTIGLIATSPTNVWCGGNPLSQSNGTSLTVASGAAGFALWAASADSIFAGTTGPDVDIWDGMTWTPSNTGTTGSTGGVWGTSSSRVFVATYVVDGEGEGSTGEVRAWNGLGWSNETLPANTPYLYAVYAAPTGEVFAFGENGTILIGP
jgi:hypothetical protein